MTENPATTSEQGVLDITKTGGTCSLLTLNFLADSPDLATFPAFAGPLAIMSHNLLYIQINGMITGFDPENFLGQFYLFAGAFS